MTARTLLSKSLGHLGALNTGAENFEVLNRGAMNYVTSRFPPLTSRSFSRQLSFLVFKAEVSRPCIPSSPSFPFFSSSFHTTVISFPRDSSNESSGPRSRKGGIREPKETPKMRQITKGEKYEPVDLETSKEYLKSEAYAKTYEGKPIWHETLYRSGWSVVSSSKRMS